MGRANGLAQKPVLWVGPKKLAQQYTWGFFGPNKNWAGLAHQALGRPIFTI